MKTYDIFYCDLSSEVNVKLYTINVENSSRSIYFVKRWALTV